LIELHIDIKDIARLMVIHLILLQRMNLPAPWPESKSTTNISLGCTNF